MASESDLIGTAVQSELLRESVETGKKEDQLEDIPGVTKIVISPSVQKSVGCVVGENVTEEKPWTYVKKVLVEKELAKDEFTTLKDDILEFPEEDFLLGYIPKEIEGSEEFYFCHKESAQKIVAEIARKSQEVRNSEMMAVIKKTPRQWTGLGSEAEVDDLLEKTSRPLIKVEIVADYPIMKSAVTFSYRKVEQAVDGYREIVPIKRGGTQVLQKLRTDAALQTALPVVNREAQTICTYPKSAWTQYEYDPKAVGISEEDEVNIDRFLSGMADDLSEKFTVNNLFNFYSRDYADLVVDEKTTRLKKKIAYKQVASLHDVKVCKSKTITAVAWNPRHVNLVVVSYAELSPNVYLKREFEGTSQNEAHAEHLLLMWSVEDDLSPVLRLETSREATALSFCPTNPSILIGGLSNGLVAVWDLSDESYLKDETKTNGFLHLESERLKDSFRRWRDIISMKLPIRAVAISQLKNSHCDAIKGVQWVSPNFLISKTGNVTATKSIDDKGVSLQFATIGLDGVVLFWELKGSETLPGIVFESVPSRRLKKCPSALRGTVSPFADNLRPLYRVELCERKPTAFALFFREEKFEVVTSTVQYGQFTEVRREETRIRGDLCVGTADGVLLKATWKALERSAEDSSYQEEEEDQVSSTEAEIITCNKYHDGPITCVSFEENFNSFLTVGGTVFAIWKADLPDMPLLWRKSQWVYSTGSWNPSNLALFELTRLDGTLESWSLLERADVHVIEQVLSGNQLIGYHTNSLKATSLGISDNNAMVRVFELPKPHDANVESFAKLLDKKCECKRRFIAWREDWEKKLTKPLVRVADVKYEKSSASKPTAEIKSRIRLTREEKERQRLVEVLLAKKRLDKRALLRKQLPLVKLKEDEMVKQKKREAMLKEMGDIYRENVAIHFPEAVRKTPPPPENPYEAQHDIRTVVDSFERFKKVCDAMEGYVERNPFVRDFNWNRVLSVGHETRSFLDVPSQNLTHKKRHGDFKTARKVAAEEAEKARLLAKKAAEIVKHSKRLTKKFSRKVGSAKETPTVQAEG